MPMVDALPTSPKKVNTEVLTLDVATGQSLGFTLGVYLLLKKQLNDEKRFDCKHPTAFNRNVFLWAKSPRKDTS